MLPKFKKNFFHVISDAKHESPRFLVDTFEPIEILLPELYRSHTTDVTEVEWSSGTKYMQRLDQGVSNWRASHSNSRQTTYFATSENDFAEIGKYLAELSVRIEGATLPTQVFAKVR